jgi:threonine synthase
MDIQISSNFERLLFEVHGRDPHAVRRMMASLAQSGAFTIGNRELDQIRHEFGSGATDEAETAATIARTLSETAELLDPHTAVGYAVARSVATSASPMVTLATAHPAKFPDAVEKASGIRPALPKRLAHLMAAEERFTVLPNDVSRVRDFILSRQQA